MQGDNYSFKTLSYVAGGHNKVSVMSGGQDITPGSPATVSFADAPSGGLSDLLHSLLRPVTSVVRLRRGVLGEYDRGPGHLGGKALVNSTQKASAGAFQTVSSPLLMSVMACVSWSLKHRWHLFPSGTVQNGVCGEEPYRQPHRVRQWMFSVENWGARDVDDVSGVVLDPTLARDGLEVLLHHALDRLLCGDAVDGGPGRGGSRRTCQRCVLHVALDCIAAPTTNKLHRLHGVAEASEELCSGNPAHVLVEAL